MWGINSKLAIIFLQYFNHVIILYSGFHCFYIKIACHYYLLLFCLFCSFKTFFLASRTFTIYPLVDFLCICFLGGCRYPASWHDVCVHIWEILNHIYIYIYFFFFFSVNLGPILSVLFILSVYSNEVKFYLPFLVYIFSLL